MKKVNFYDAYNKIKAKLVESNNTDGLETLKRFINQDKDLSKQFMLTSYVQTLSGTMGVYAQVFSAFAIAGVHAPSQQTD